MDEDQRRAMVAKTMREFRRRQQLTAPVEILEPLEPLESFEEETALVKPQSQALERATYATTLMEAHGYSPGQATMHVLALVGERTGVPAAQLKELGLIMSVDVKDHLNHRRFSYCATAVMKYIPEVAVSSLKTRHGQRKLFDLVKSALEVHDEVADLGVTLSYDQIVEAMTSGHNAEAIIETAQYIANRASDELMTAKAGAYRRLAHRVLRDSVQKGCSPISLLERELPNEAGPSLDELLHRDYR